MPTADSTASPLRILMVAPVAPSRGGIAQFGTMLVNALREQHEVTCWAIDPLYPNVLFPGNTQPAIGSMLSCRIEARIHGWNPVTWVTAWRTVRHYDFDIVIWQWWTPYWVPFLLMLVAQAKLRGLATIALNHQLVEPDAPQWQALIARMMLTRADAVVHFGNSIPMHPMHRNIPLHSMAHSCSVSKHPSTSVMCSTSQPMYISFSALGLCGHTKASISC